MIGALLLAARLLLDAPLASELVGGEWLVRICRRESGCPVGLVGVHEGDAHWERVLGEGMSTRGVHGMMAAHSMRFLPSIFANTPELLDIPLVSAYVANRRAHAPTCRQHRECRRWRGW